MADLTLADVQQWLKDGGYYPGRVDGLFGTMTDAAIRRAAHDKNLVISFGWSEGRRVVAAKQMMLKMLGFQVGPIDGLAGPQTQFAIDQWAAKFRGAPAVDVPDRDVDPPTVEPAGHPPIWPRQADVERFYGQPGEHLVRLALPFPMRIAWDLSSEIRGFMVHEKVHDSAARVFDRIADHYAPGARADLGLDIFGGCFNKRLMRGGTRWSMHSWGIAIDFDPVRNALKSTKTTARLGAPDAETFWRLWEEEGWVSLGRVRNFDWMHVQAARL